MSGVNHREYFWLVMHVGLSVHLHIDTPSASGFATVAFCWTRLRAIVCCLVRGWLAASDHVAATRGWGGGGFGLCPAGWIYAANQCDMDSKSSYARPVCSLLRASQSGNMSDNIPDGLTRKKTERTNSSRLLSLEGGNHLFSRF